jgi:hypothetical protein
MTASKAKLPEFYFKRTRQGVRDLGGNRRRPPPDEDLVVTTYKVDVGYPERNGGMILAIETTSCQGAIRRAKEIIAKEMKDDTNASWSVLRVHRGDTLVWDHLNGYV